MFHFSFILVSYFTCGITNKIEILCIRYVILFQKSLTLIYHKNTCYKKMCVLCFILEIQKLSFKRFFSKIFLNICIFSIQLWVLIFFYFVIQSILEYLYNLSWNNRTIEVIEVNRKVPYSFTNMIINNELLIKIRKSTRFGEKRRPSSYYAHGETLGEVAI